VSFNSTEPDRSTAPKGRRPRSFWTRHGDGSNAGAATTGTAISQNGSALDDTDERLYDLMIGVATKAIGKPEIATTLRSLIAPVSC